MGHPIKVYCHGDVDAFYASAAQAKNRFLREKPVGILSNQGYFVVAKSLELKRYGVTTGEPLPDAIKKCPHAIFVKRDFAWYNALSSRFHEFMRYLSPECEEYSVDESFFVMPQYATPATYARNVQQEVKRKIGLPITIGVARTKTLAKLFSDTAKPFGIKVVLDEANERELLAKLPVAEVSGIAARRARRLAAYGITTCLDFVNSDPRFIRQLLTVEGLKFWYELRGDPVLPIQTKRKRYQILTRGGSVGVPTYKADRAWGFVVKNLERLIEELHHHQLKTGQVQFSLELRNREYQSFYRFGKTRLEAPTDRFDILVDVFGALFKQCYIPGLLVSRMHLLALGLEDRQSAQMGLFDPPAEPEETIACTKRIINKAVSRFAVRSGATLPLKDWYDDPALGVEAIAPQRTVY